MRTVRDLHPFTIPAGAGCDFAVEAHPSWGFSAKTEFSDGLMQY
jgi:hypothetical protein